MDYSYKEVDKALENRISAHAKYSNFNLHEWLSKKFNIKSSDNIMDLGCGDGNFIDLFWNAIKPDGKLDAIDINEDLINIARNKYSSLSDNISINVTNYDKLKPSNKKYDWVFSIYSIYLLAFSGNSEYSVMPSVEDNHPSNSLYTGSSLSYSMQAFIVSVSSRTSSLVMHKSVTEFVKTAFLRATRSNQPHLRGLPVVAPNSLPLLASSSPSSSNNSV